MTMTPPRQRRRAVVASTIGAALEWYDFTLYGLASAVVLGPLFFPSDDPVISLLGSFASFGVGFFARPFGGFIFGNLGDRVGRRQILVVTLVLMSVSTFLIGVLPTFDSVGFLAPALLVLLRILQGLGAGAEYAGATLLASEYAPDKHRGLISAIPAAGNPVGVILASAVFGAFTLLPGDQFLSWGWRVPFLLSAVLFLVGLWIRVRIAESPVFEAHRAARPAERRVGVFTLLRHYPIPLLKAVMLNAGPNVTSYLPAVYALSYLTGSVGLEPTAGTNALIVGNLGAIVILPIAGIISDRIGRRAVFIFGAVLAAAMSFPFFALLDTGNTLLIWAGYLLMFAVAGHSLLGAQASLLPEQFPTDVRYSGIAVSRELASALVGGTLPFVATGIVALTGGSWGVSLLVLVIALIAGTGALLMREGKGQSLHDVPAHAAHGTDPAAAGPRS